MSNDDYRYPFSPFPDGWYCLGFTEELKPGGILTRAFMGQEIVIFRTESGKVAATDAHCPHMGGHLGYGGEIQGEVIRCPFHSFCFDTNGTCTATGYGTKPPPKAILRTWPIREMHGLLLVYYDADHKEPTWEVPDIDTDGWLPVIHKDFEVRSHPQETTENSVDFGHFGIIHGYSNTAQLSDLVVEGPYLTARYTMDRVADVFLKSDELLTAEFEVHVWGLGYSLVEVEVKKYGMRARVWVLPSPMDGDMIALRAASTIHGAFKPRNINWILGLIPTPWAKKLVRKMTLKGYCDDLKQDFEVWTHKSYVDPPALAKGDGPIAAYRKYCRQFYPELRPDAGESGRHLQVAAHTSES
jgi:nitrite reductase/ring-hydroxylating ferredoxin subunit